MTLSVASLFSDHMVLQRDNRVAVWGWAAPGERVEVVFEPGSGAAFPRQVHATKTDSAGAWRTALDPVPACTMPARLLVSAASGERVVVSDILVGDVWFCSGQSNMQMPLSGCFGAATEIADAHAPLLRLFTVPAVLHLAPPRDIAAVWQTCMPETARNFSAVGYFFGRELLRAEPVPIGLMNVSWGGTCVETWISRDGLLTDDLCRREVETYERRLAELNTEQARQSRELCRRDPNAWTRAHAVPDPGDTGHAQGWADLAFDDAAWPEMPIPSMWQSNGVPGNGVLWFRRTVDVPVGWAGRDLLLCLGCCDKHDTTWFNNVQVGGTSWETQQPWAVSRVYRVPGRLVHAGRNMIATRVYSYRNAGGITGPAEDMQLRPVDSAPDSLALPLAGYWRYRIEHDFGVARLDESDFIPNQNSPYALFDSMVSTAAPFALRGFIWYQGESNAADPGLYRTRFPLLIRDWRRVFHRPDLPFLFVQLAGFRSSGTWPMLRLAQTMGLREPHTGMATAVDIGDAIDIHPRNKREVGRRLALVAATVAGGRKVVSSGPLFATMRTQGNRLRLAFDTVGSGLVASTRFGPTGAPLAAGDAPAAGDADVRGFIVAGADKRFVPAKARIDNGNVIVWSDLVPHPVAARYAWSDYPDGNLYNREGLPTPPFRTDDWPA